MTAVMPSSHLHILWRMITEKWQEAKKVAPVIVEYVPTSTFVEIAATPTTPAPMSNPLFSPLTIFVCIWLLAYTITFFSNLSTRLVTTAADNAYLREKDDLEKRLATEIVQRARMVLDHATEIGEIENANDIAVTALKDQYERELTSLRNAHRNDIATLKDQHQQEIASLNDAHAKATSTSNDQHQRELSSMSSAHLSAIDTLERKSSGEKQVLQREISLAKAQNKERKLRIRTESEVARLQLEVEELQQEIGNIVHNYRSDVDREVLAVKEEAAKTTAQLTARIDKLQRKRNADLRDFEEQTAELTMELRDDLRAAQKEADKAKRTLRGVENHLKLRETAYSELGMLLQTTRAAASEQQAKTANDIARLSWKFGRKLRASTKHVSSMVRQIASQKVIEESLRKELGELHATIAAKEQVIARAEMVAAKPPVRSRRGMLRESSGHVTAHKTWKAPESAAMRKGLVGLHAPNSAEEQVTAQADLAAAKLPERSRRGTPEESTGHVTAQETQMAPESADAMSKLMAEYTAMQAQSARNLESARLETSTAQKDSAEAKHEAAQANSRAAEAVEQLSVAQSQLEEVQAVAAQAETRATEAVEQLSVAQIRLEEVQANASAAKASEDASKAQNEMQLEQARRETADRMRELEAANRVLAATEQQRMIWEGKATDTAVERDAVRAKLDETQQQLAMAQHDGNTVVQQLRDSQALAAQIHNDANQTFQGREADLLVEGNALALELQVLRQEHEKLRQEHGEMSTVASRNLMQAEIAEEELKDLRPKYSMLLEQWKRKEKKERQMVSAAVDALPQPATMDDLARMIDEDKDEPIDKDLDDALSAEWEAQDQAESNPPATLAGVSTPGPPPQTAGGSQVVKPALKFKPKPGGYRRAVAGSSQHPTASSQPSTTSDSLPGLFAAPSASLPGLPPPRPASSSVLPSPPKSVGLFVFPTVSAGGDDKDNVKEQPKIPELVDAFTELVDSKWYGEQPPGWRPDMPFEKERELRIDGRATELQELLSEGLKFDFAGRDLNFLLGKVWDDVNTALWHWRSRAIREVTPPPPSAEEMLRISQRPKVQPKSRRPQPPPPPQV